MATNLTDLFKNSFGDMLVRECSGLLGESAQSISASVDAIVSSVFSSLILKGNTDQGTRSLLDFISDNGLQDLSFNSSGNIELLNKGASVLTYLFGNHTTPLTDSISSAGGLKTSSASSLLKMVAPLVLGFFGRFVKDNSLSTSGIKELLLAQEDIVRQNIPAPINDLLAFPKAASAPSSSLTNPEMMSYHPSTGISKFLPWIVLLLASLGLFYFLQKGCNAQIHPENMPPTETRDTM